MRTLLASVVIAVVLRPLAAASDPAYWVDMVPPFRISAFSIYADGGTVPFGIEDAKGHTMVGCFDGRMQGIRDAVLDIRPVHCYVGGMHPDEPWARALPLWGEEERALLRLIDEALSSQLTTEQRTRLQKKTYPLDDLDEHEVRLWHLLHAFDRRMRLNRCIDEGIPACPDCIASYIGAATPITLDAVSRSDSMTAYVASLRDANGKKFEIVLPADTIAAFTPSQLRSGSSFQLPFGSVPDRCALATLSLAKPHTALELYSALIRIVRARIRSTMQSDARR